jgi:hypothetical protein
VTKAKGKVEEVELLQIAGLDTRVWQKDGSSTDNTGVVFTLAGEVAKIGGIQPLLKWARSSTVTIDPKTGEEMSHTGASPFYDDEYGYRYPLMSIGSFNLNGAVEILLEFGGMLAVLRGNNVELLAVGRRVAKRPSEGTQFLQVGGAVLILNGVDRNLKWDGHILSPLGILSAPSAPETPSWNTGELGSTVPFGVTPGNGVLAEAYSGSAIIKTSDDISNEYRYRLTWVNNQGSESEASAPSELFTDLSVTPAVGVDVAFWVRVSGLGQAPPQPDIIGRRLYRAGASGVTYYLLADLPGGLSDLYNDGSSITYESPVALSPTGYNLPPPTVKFAMFLRGITFYAGNKSAPNALYYSRGNGMKESVPQPRNVVQVTTEDGSDYITAMCVASDYGLVFTNRSIHMVTISKSGEPIITPVSQTIGAVGSRAVVNFEGRVFFFSENGVFSFDGAAPRPLSSELSNLVGDLPPAFLVDVVAFSEPKERRVCFSVRSSTPTRNDVTHDEFGHGPVPSYPGIGEVKEGRLRENNEVWSVHVDTGAISKSSVSVFDAMSYKGETLVAFSRDHYGPFFLHQYTASADYVHPGVPESVWFRLTDLGMWDCQSTVGEREGFAPAEPIHSFFETRWLTGKNPESDKTFYRLDVFYVQTGDYEIDLAWFTDWETKEIGSASVPMMDPSAVTWGGTAENAIETVGAVSSSVRNWGDVYPGLDFEPKIPTTWGEERLRSVKISLSSGTQHDPSGRPFPVVPGSSDPVQDLRISVDESEGLTAKSIKFRFGTPEMTNKYPRAGREIDNWKIVGFVLFYTDHGIRAEGTDVGYEQPTYESWLLDTP